MTKITTFNRPEYLEDLINTDRIIGFRDMILPTTQQRAMRNGNEVVEYNLFPTEFGCYMNIKTAYCYVPEEPKDYTTTDCGNYDLNF